MDVLRRQSARASQAWSQRTSRSTVSSEPSELECIMSSQGNSPATTPKSKRCILPRGTGDHSTLSSIDDKTKPMSEPQQLTSPIAPPSYDNGGDSKISVGPTPAVTSTANNCPRTTSELTPAPRYSDEASTGRNSLEWEIVPNPKGQGAVVTAIKLLSACQNLSVTAQLQYINNLHLPEPTSRALGALATNVFTPTQLRAARQIQSRLNHHPAESIPMKLITDEIAEIDGDHGWCLIGKCGLARVSYKIILTSAGIATDTRLEEDQPWKPVQALADHIRNAHFKWMPFQCLACPASFDGEDELNSHLRTHLLGDLECASCGVILYNNELQQRHRHSNYANKNIGDKLRRLLIKVAPLK